jgi:hypothetical protein
MPNEFAITAAANTIHLDDRHGETTFTVFNASGRPLRGRAQLTSETPNVASWLSLTGEPTRDFAVAGTQQYSVNIDIPPDTPPGSYPFRLDMIGVENPDEEYTRGPVVTFEAPAPTETNKPFPWWIILIVVGVVAVIGLVLFLLLRNPNVEVPSVPQGSTIAEATTLLGDEGLEVGEIRPVIDDDVPEGEVVGTDPAGGEEVAKGTTVDLLVSAGPETVRLPDVDDRTESDARRLLEEACEPEPCVTVTVNRENHPTVDEGRVISTDPAGNSEVPIGSEVTMVISEGPAEETIDLVPTDDVYWDPPGTLYVINQVPDFTHGPLLQLWRAPGETTSSSTSIIAKIAPEDVLEASSADLLEDLEIVKPSDNLLFPLPQPTLPPAATLGPPPIFGPQGPGLVTIRFDMNAIPSGADIVRAELNLYMEEAETTGLTVNARPATASWSEADPQKPTCDTSNAVSKPVPVDPGWNTWDVTALARDHYADAGTNYGYCLTVDQVGRRTFTSREGPSTQRPTLTVTYRP